MGERKGWDGEREDGWGRVGTCINLTTNKFAKLSKARRDHGSWIIEDHKSLMKVGPPNKNLKLKISKSRNL